MKIHGVIVDKEIIFKPCPFCGGDDIKADNRSYRDHKGEITQDMYWFVGCRDGKCFVTGPTSDISLMSAVDKWNSRNDN